MAWIVSVLSVDSPPSCTACDAGAPCGYCLRLLAGDECPKNVEDVGNAGFPPCEAGRVAPGQWCEADGMCGTSDVIDNCDYRTVFGGTRPYDFYKRVACTLSPSPPPMPVPPLVPPPPSFPLCAATCEAGSSCGYCLRLLPSDECPRRVSGAENAGLPPCEDGKVAPGQLCEGDGGCDTSDVIDNCDYRTVFGSLRPFDLYVRVACTLSPSPPPAPPLPPAPHSPPSAPPPPHLPHCAAKCEAGWSCGYCLRRLPSAECPTVNRVSAGLPSCEAGRVAPGQLCEGDGGCDTSDVIDNCGYETVFSRKIPLDFYMRERCDFSPFAPPRPPAAPLDNASLPMVSFVMLVIMGTIATCLCKRSFETFQQRRKQGGMTAVEPDETELLRLSELMPTPRGGGGPLI